MERSRLSIRALVVLASELGAEHLFGVRDPFMMMDHEEIRAAYEVCLEELEQSGAITRQFEGAAIVRGDLRRLIEICAECDLYLTVDAVNCGQAEPSVVLYRQGSCWAQLTKDGELASLTGAADGEIEELALARLMECCKAQEAPEAQTHWSLTNELLQHCLKDTDAGRAELLAAGMPEDAAALLLAGLERRCGYCCVNTVHLQTRTLESLCLVYDSDMLLRLEPGEEETEDWIVRRSTPEQIRRTLRALVREARRNEGLSECDRDPDHRRRAAGCGASGVPAGRGGECACSGNAPRPVSAGLRQLYCDPPVRPGSAHCGVQNACVLRDLGRRKPAGLRYIGVICCF